MKKVVQTIKEVYTLILFVGGGFGFNDLKPNLQEAYKKIMCQFNLRTNMVNASERKVEWIVDL